MGSDRSSAEIHLVEARDPLQLLQLFQFSQLERCRLGKSTDLGRYTRYRLLCKYTHLWDEGGKAPDKFMGPHSVNSPLAAEKL